MAPPALPGFTATTRRSAPAPRIATLPLTDSAARSSRSRQPAAGHNRSTGRPPHRGAGSHVPHESPDHARATSTPDTAWPINRHPPDSSQSRKDSLVSMSPKLLTTLHQWFARARLRDPHLPRSKTRLFPTTLTTTALDRSSSGWFAASACTATAEGHQTHSGPAPPSLVQHRIQRLGLLHPASFNVRVRTSSPISRPASSAARSAARHCRRTCFPQSRRMRLFPASRSTQVSRARAGETRSRARTEDSIGDRGHALGDRAVRWSLRGHGCRPSRVIASYPSEASSRSMNAGSTAARITRRRGAPAQHRLQDGSPVAQRGRNDSGQEWRTDVPRAPQAEFRVS